MTTKKIKKNKRKKAKKKKSRAPKNLPVVENKQIEQSLVSINTPITKTTQVDVKSTIMKNNKSNNDESSNLLKETPIQYGKKCFIR